MQTDAQDELVVAAAAANENARSDAVTHHWPPINQC